MKAKLTTLAIPVIGILLIPLYLIASIIIGQDLFDWLEENKA